MTSVIVRTPVACQDTSVFGVFVVLPIQKNLRVSNSTPAPPSAWWLDMFCMMACSEVPSCAATVAM
jgi:hypothetical protein